MDSPCIKQTVCEVLKIFQHGKYLVANVLKLQKSQDLLKDCFKNVNIYRYINNLLDYKLKPSMLVATMLILN